MMIQRVKAWSPEVAASDVRSDCGVARRVTVSEAIAQHRGKQSQENAVKE